MAKFIRINWTFISDNNEIESYVYQGVDKNDFLNDDKWVSSVGQYVENQEYLQVTIDSSNKLIYGIKKDGIHEFYTPISIGGNEYYVSENQDWLKVITDQEGRIIAGIRPNGTTYIAEIEGIDIESIKDSIKEINNTIFYIENHEYVDIKTDSSDNIIEATKIDGVKVFPSGIDVGGNVNIKGNNIMSFDDSENRTQMTIDCDDKIISYRKDDGTKVENVGIETNKLTLTDDGMSDFKKDLKAAGFSSGSGDWSDYISNDGDKPLCIPTPRCAILNILSDFDLSSLSKKGRAGAIDGVNYNVPTFVEFWDMQGNYFKKWVIMSGQGASTMSFAKKNIALDFFDSDVNGDALKIKFGNWVPQDSFHLKSYLLELTKVKAIGSYTLFNDILKSRGVINDYSWKKQLMDGSEIQPTDSRIESIKDLNTLLDNGARCFPDGFPCILYSNGEFWGIYVWQTKKHRDVYKMKKDNSKHIHLDGSFFDIFTYNGDLDWDVISGTKPNSLGFVDSLEIRNPKNLYLMDGTEYDGDINLGELIDETSPYYDPNNKNHVNTKKVKQSLIDLSYSMSNINAAADVYENSEKTENDLIEFKNVFERYFDPDNLIDYLIVGDVVQNWDGFKHNGQWTTWDGKKWFINMYDVDNTFGDAANSYYRPRGTHITQFNNDTKLCIYEPLIKYYNPELENRYKVLRDSKIIDSYRICEILTNFQQRINSSYFKLDFDKWEPTTHYLSDMTRFDSIYRISKWMDENIRLLDILYNYEN